MFRLLVRATALLFTLFLGLTVFVVWDGAQDRRGPAAVILVLGSGGVNPDGTLTERERVRLDRAIEVAAEQPRAVVLASGAAEIHGQSEAALMAAYLAAHGLPTSRIVPDAAGATTWDSARNAAAYLRDRGLKGEGVLVVSEYFHIPRARLALRRFGAAPVYSSPAFHINWNDVRALAREACGLIVYRLRPLS